MQEVQVSAPNMAMASLDDAAALAFLGIASIQAAERCPCQSCEQDREFAIGLPSSKCCSCHPCLGRSWLRTILVSLSLDRDEDTGCLELLSWVIAVAAQPGDIVIAMHLSEGAQSKDARARGLGLLEQCKELCHFRQVAGELRMLTVGPPLETTIMEQALMLGARMLVLSSTAADPNANFGIYRKGGLFDFRHPPPLGSSVLFIGDGDEGDESIHMPANQRLCSQCDCGRNVLDGHSPRGVLAGPTPESEGASPSSGSSSGCESKPLLPLTTLTSTPVCDDDGSNDSDTQTSCLNIFKSLAVSKRQSSLSGRSIRARRLLSSFSCGSIQSPHYNVEAEVLDSSSLHRPGWRCFSYDELEASTSGFHPDNLVGKGGYAEVYRGSLSDGRLVAVKKLIKGEAEQQTEGGFLTELGIIGHVSHPNTTSLIGFCVERGLHLVFPYSSNGSLSSLLHGPKNKSLVWPLRHKIAVGTAKGLHYLHKLCPRRIIHRDIKASNILLGPDFEPQISDFGLAKWLPEQWTHHTVTPIEGTFGYLAPEYFMHGIVDEKTDVFAYGVLLLELITGRKPIDSSQRNIVLWARPHLECSNIQELVDPNLGGAFDIEQMRRLVLTAALCVRQSPVWRPCINQVLKLLTSEQETQEMPNNWSTMACSSADTGDYEYTSKEYHTDMSRHRALAFET